MEAIKADIISERLETELGKTFFGIFEYNMSDEMLY